MQPAHARLHGLRVLIVEDEPLILIDCETILKDIGVGTVVGVTTAKDAVHAVENADAAFHVAILDVSLQDSSSLPLADVLEARGVITGFMSGYGHDDLPEQFQARPYVAKPFVPAQLKAMLEELIGLDSRSASQPGTPEGDARCQGK